jgi:hypothetical protein
LRDLLPRYDLLPAGPQLLARPDGSAPASPAMRTMPERGRAIDRLARAWPSAVWERLLLCSLALLLMVPAGEKPREVSDLAGA